MNSKWVLLVQMYHEGSAMFAIPMESEELCVKAKELVEHLHLHKTRVTYFRTHEDEKHD
jgi:hypothetical protein